MATSKTSRKGSRTSHLSLWTHQVLGNRFQPQKSKSFAIHKAPPVLHLQTVNAYNHQVFANSSNVAPPVNANKFVAPINEYNEATRVIAKNLQVFVSKSDETTPANAYEFEVTANESNKDEAQPVNAYDNKVEAAANETNLSLPANAYEFEVPANDSNVQGPPPPV